MDNHQKTIECRPLVSIVCESYNHESFLRKCIDGFLMQKTDFPFEILIHDDASTDKSAAIIREYEALYPELIKPIYQKENQYSKGEPIWALIQFPRAKGKYVALCEGDDYWTDPLKLQKQVNYLEAHPDCSMCFHNTIIHWYDASQDDSIYYPNLENRDYSGPELLLSRIPATASLVFRLEVAQKFTAIMPKYPLIKVGDRPINVFCAQSGKIHALPEVMSVYGKHQDGWSRFDDAQKTYQYGLSVENERTVYGEEYHSIMTSMMTGLYLNAMFRALRQHKPGVFFKSLYRGILRQPITGLHALMRIPGERKKRINS